MESFFNYYKEFMQLNWNFQTFTNQKNPRGGIGRFSGTTQ